MDCWWIDPAAASSVLHAEVALMQLLIDTTGRVRCIYSDALGLHRIGRLAIERASSVEPDEAGHWYADLSSVQGPVLGPYQRRLRCTRGGATLAC